MHNFLFLYNCTSTLLDPNFFLSFPAILNPNPFKYIHIVNRGYCPLKPYVSTSTYNIVNHTVNFKLFRKLFKSYTT
ncbi:hypothetical protein BCVP_CDS0137 [Bacillus phage BC-VP]|nr:hypothetical protein BCVP_CDS0137 [Bacillus phage BC-VP]